MSVFKRMIITLVLVLVSCHAFAAAVPVAPLWAGIFDNNGQPLAGGAVYFYAAGTGTAKTVWHDIGMVFILAMTLIVFGWEWVRNRLVK